MSDTSADTLVAPKPDTAAAAAVVNKITINLPPAVVSSPKKVPEKRLQPSGREAAPFKKIPGPPASLGDIITSSANPVTTEHYYDAQNGTVKFTRLRDDKGGEAILREDPSDHAKVTLSLTSKDRKSVLTTQGDERGYDANVEGKPQATTAYPVVRDTLTCNGKGYNLTTNETESVTRDKLQQFAGDYPQLAAALRKIELPVTVVGGLPVSFAKAVDTPTQYRACPEDRSGIGLERLTEKSAARK
jgi:hypothetical protein